MPEETGGEFANQAQKTCVNGSQAYCRHLTKLLSVIEKENNFHGSLVERGAYEQSCASFTWCICTDTVATESVVELRFSRAILHLILHHSRPYRFPSHQECSRHLFVSLLHSSWSTSLCSDSRPICPSHLKARKGHQVISARNLAKKCTNAKVEKG